MLEWIIVGGVFVALLGGAFERQEPVAVATLLWCLMLAQAVLATAHPY